MTDQTTDGRTDGRKTRLQELLRAAKNSCHIEKCPALQLNLYLYLLNLCGLNLSDYHRVASCLAGQGQTGLPTLQLI